MPVRNVIYRQREAGHPLTDLSDYRRAGGYEGLRTSLERDGPRRGRSTRSAAPACAAAAAPASRWARKASFIPKDVGAAGLRRVQRRRERARHLQGPRDHGGQPLPAASRGSPSRATRSARCAATSTSAASTSTRPACSTRPSPRPGRPACLGMRVMDIELRLRHHPLPRRGRLHLRRGDGPAGEPGGQARPAAAEAPVPRRGRPLRRAHAHQQRRDAGGAARRSSRTARTGTPRMGTEKSTGTKVFSISGHVVRPGNYEIVMHETTLRELVYDLAGGFRPGRDFKAAWVGGSSVNVVGAEAPRHPARLRVARRRRHLAGLGRLHRDGRLRQHRALHAAPGATSTGTSRAGSARPAARGRSGWSGSFSGSWTARAGWRTWS